MSKKITVSEESKAKADILSTLPDFKEIKKVYEKALDRMIEEEPHLKKYVEHHLKLRNEMSVVSQNAE